MIRVLCTLVLCTVTLAVPFMSDLDKKWEAYKTLYNKTYLSDTDEKERRMIWEENVKLVQKHNSEADLRKHDFRLGINHLSDKSPEEYMGTNGLILIPNFKQFFETIQNEVVQREEERGEKNDEDNIPKHVDWREKGYVTPVQNQGFCGACWAFSALGSLEAQYKKKTGKLVPLSTQNLIDCSRTTGNLGCKGGGIDSSFAYIKRNRGIDTEESYPYSGQVIPRQNSQFFVEFFLALARWLVKKQDVLITLPVTLINCRPHLIYEDDLFEEGECQFRRNSIGAKLKGWIDVKQFDEKALMKAVATVGPVSVGINSEGYGFKHYRSGVYDVPNCYSYMVNHGVVVVGYGTTESGKDYWVVKNSWGPFWGEEGYIRMSRNKNNQCGIASLASYPTV